MFIKPMLAALPTKKVILTDGSYVAEEKYDGFRLIVETVNAGGLYRQVAAWSRYGRRHDLSPALVAVLRKLPPGVWDGELIAQDGSHSWDVATLINAEHLRFVAFDVLSLFAELTTSLPYEQRRSLLFSAFEQSHLESERVLLAKTMPVSSQAELEQAANDVWERNGEGLILKRRDGLYRPGARGKEFVKIKKCEHDTLTVVGFEPSKGGIMDRGPYAVVVLRDEEGNITTVKTKNDRELQQFNLAAPGFMERHPAIGRRLVIAFQGRTPDGGYRHPRWDRWEEK